MKNIFKNFIIIFLLISPIVLSSCEKSANWTVYANINNNTKEKAYLWFWEREKPQPSDLVAPWQFITTSIGFKWYEWDGRAYFSDQIKLHSSKDWVNQDRETVLPIKYDYTAGKSMIIKWTGSIFTIEY